MAIPKRVTYKGDVYTLVTTGRSRTLMARFGRAMSRGPKGTLDYRVFVRDMGSASLPNRRYALYAYPVGRRSTKRAER